jgi:Protein of unknown function (DUF2806)
LTDESNLPAPPSPETPNTEDGFAAIIDVLGDAATGIPAPIRKNFWKAFGQLCTAAVDMPVSILEGKAAEKRAESKARVKLISTSADQIAKQMVVDPEYVRLAAQKFTKRVVREQINLDKISLIAFDELRGDDAADLSTDEAATNQPVQDISADWLNVFEREAAQMSSDEMQRLLGKILAGEIRKPSSFSIKTVSLVAQLDGRPAALFRKLCSLSVSLRIPGSNDIVDARVVSLAGQAGQNSLQPYGLRFDFLNVLQEYGLIIPDYNSYMDYQASIAREGKVSVGITFENRLWGLVHKAPPPIGTPFNLHGVSLSRSGKELLPIVEGVPDDQYRAALKAYLETRGFDLIPIAYSPSGEVTASAK